MFFESLETRVLMSVSPVLSTAVHEARAEVMVAWLRFELDAATYGGKLLGDVAALQADDVGQDQTLAPLFATLHGDVKAMRQQLAADILNERGAVLADESTIALELAQMVSDQGNSVALASDHQALLAVRVKLQADEMTGLNNRLNTREADYTKIFNDVTAISTALEGDGNARAQVIANVNKFTTDRTACLDAMTTDLNAVITARTALRDALKAMES